MCGGCDVHASYHLVVDCAIGEEEFEKCPCVLVAEWEDCLGCGGVAPVFQSRCGGELALCCEGIQGEDQ